MIAQCSNVQFVRAQCAHAQYTNKTKTYDLIDFLSENNSWLVIFIFLTSLSLVKCQPLNLPAERFPCGTSDLTCERWGYTACMKPDEEFYCLSCDHEYLRTLCGTKEEAQGCNLYCTQKTLDVETDKMRLEFAKERNDLIANFSDILIHLRKMHSKENTNSQKINAEGLTNLQSDMSRELQDLQAQLDISRNETKIQESREISLGQDLARKTLSVEILENKYSVLQAILIVVAGVVACAAAIKLFLWCRRWKRQTKTEDDIERQEKSTFLVKDETDRRISQYSDESGVDLTIPAVQDDATETEDLKDKASIEQETENTCVMKQDSCPGDGCPGYRMMQMIPPTDENSSSEIAI